MRQPLVMARRIVILFLFLLSGAPGQAETVQEASAPDPVVEIAPAAQNEAPQSSESRPPWMERFHLSASSSLLELSRDLDNFFIVADVNDFEQSQTRLQERLGVQVDSAGRTVFLQRFYARLDLPKTEERLGLFFAQNNEEEDAGELVTPTPRRTSANVRLGTTTGLRFVLSRNDWHLVQYRIGATVLPRWQRFSELGGELRLPFGKFLLRPRQLLFWRDQDGLGETTRFDLDYQVRPQTVLRWREEGTFSEASSGYEFLNALYLLQQVGAPVDGKELLISLEAEGRTRPASEIVGYLVGFSWRQLLYGDWLFIESGGNVTFREERSFRGVTAIFVLLEVNFGGASAETAPTTAVLIEHPAAAGH